MTTRPTIIIAWIAFLSTCLCAQENKPTPAPVANAPAVTYIANEGFLLEHGGKKVLIDALFNAGDMPYLSPTPEVIAEMTEARGPFANVDLLLVTHAHADHFNAKMVAAFLGNHPKCRLLAPVKVVERLRSTESFDQIRDQVRPIDLDCGANEQVGANEIPVEVLGLSHNGHQSAGHPTPEKATNLAYIINLGGVRFLHMGDASIEGNLVHLENFAFDRTPVDVLFMGGRGRSPVTEQFIAHTIKPSRIVAMHIPPAELAKETEQIRAAYPYAIIFKQSMERRSLPIEVDFHTLSGDYLGQPLPGATPQVFAREIVSTAAGNEHSAPSFSPDGNEVFWWANRSPDPGPPLSMTMRRENGRWSAPRSSPFDIMPVFSPDGQRVYFFGRSQPGEANPLDIWYAEKEGSNWGQPKCLNLVSRYPELEAAYMPSISSNGTLYFVAKQGIYRTELINGAYAKPELLPQSINLPSFLNWAPFIAPDESFLLFSSNRTGALDRYGDLYISRQLADGTWTDPVSLGEPVNTRRQEVFPGMSPDGKYLFFCRDTRGRKNDVYWVDAATIPAFHRTSITPASAKPQSP